MFTNRELEKNGPLSHNKKKVLLYKILDHHMKNQGLSIQTRQMMWVSASINRKIIDFDEK